MEKPVVLQTLSSSSSAEGRQPLQVSNSLTEILSTRILSKFKGEERRKRVGRAGEAKSGEKRG